MLRFKSLSFTSLSNKSEPFLTLDSLIIAPMLVSVIHALSLFDISLLAANLAKLHWLHCLNLALAELALLTPDRFVQV